ncbi:hypothetical protein L207DRAFT_519466 [Hyaloscypha variabilis F]|uniref:Uncharacterized protein n=1 Tax=Hyaloscypha variabilis (strain UAMH 11265 / GT02V1 / F) TaxID=1149755 RepID=A0A2J6QY53_HYAVF|nr:hypothetical protein L207DRAFT_519466 [Hyaloscypha variabilis F]
MSTDNPYPRVERIEEMEATSSVRSPPPPYTSNLPDLDFRQQGQHAQSQTVHENQQGSQKTQQGALHQHPQLAPQYQFQQYPLSPRGYAPQPHSQPFYYQYPPPSFAIPVPIYPIQGPVFYHPTVPYSTPYFHQPPLPQHQPIQFHPPQLTYQPLPPPFSFAATQPYSPAIQTQGQQQSQPNTNGIQVGFVPHPPAILPGIPGVHHYPLIVRKEGDGPPPEPVFVDRYAAYEGGQVSRRAPS